MIETNGSFRDALAQMYHDPSLDFVAVRYDKFARQIQMGGGDIPHHFDLISDFRANTPHSTLQPLIDLRDYTKFVVKFDEMPTEATGIGYYLRDDLRRDPQFPIRLADLRVMPETMSRL